MCLALHVMYRLLIRDKENSVCSFDRVNSVGIVTEYFVYNCSGSNSFEKQFFVIEIS